MEWECESSPDRLFGGCLAQTGLASPSSPLRNYYFCCCHYYYFYYHYYILLSDNDSHCLPMLHCHDIYRSGLPKIDEEHVLLLESLSSYHASSLCQSKLVAGPLGPFSNQIVTGVQPALPSLNTEWLIYENTRNWLHTAVDILKDHYGKALQEARAELLEASRVRWERGMARGYQSDQSLEAQVMRLCSGPPSSSAKAGKVQIR